MRNETYSGAFFPVGEYVKKKLSIEQELENQLLNGGLPIVNAHEEKDLDPWSFRRSDVYPGDRALDTRGLDMLRVSGSSQFSERGLEAIKKKLGDKGHVTVVNLRQEDGGFVEPKEGGGAVAFSYMMPMRWWTGEDPAGTRTVAQIEKSEERRMASILPNRKFTMYGTGDSKSLTDAHQVSYKVDMVVQRALTERQLVTEKGMGYWRIPDKKFGNMEFEHVDNFVTFVRNLPANEWVHFHCKRGHSRTTMFMAMFDMMKNSDFVSAENIIKRQGPSGLGGANLLELPAKTDWDHTFKKGWLDFLYQFHTYCKENMRTGFEMSWSQWCKEKGIMQLPPVVTGDDNQKVTIVADIPGGEDGLKDRTLVLNTANERKESLANFRHTQALYLDTEFNRTGLSSYFASGSSQYSKEGLDLFFKALQRNWNVPAKNVTVVDLRHDDHLFVNGFNVSTFETKSAMLKPRTPEAIFAAEAELKEALAKQDVLRIHAIETKYPKDEFDDRFTMTLSPRTVETPQEVVTKAGANYLLIGSKRFSEASDEDVNRFIDYFRLQPKDHWFHLHCKKGKSRTTFFMVLLDMMHNADKVSMPDIIRRQKAIGGIDLFDITPKDPTWRDEKESKKQWIQFMARFHRYCQENIGSNFAVNWSSWSAAHADYQPNIDHLAINRNPAVQPPAVAVPTPTPQPPLPVVAIPTVRRAPFFGSRRGSSVRPKTVAIRG